MTGVFDADIQTAKELLALYGQDCHWQKPAPAVEDVPGYPEDGPLPAPIPCKIAFFAPRDLGRGTNAFLAALAGTEVPSNTQIGLLAGGLSFTPELADTIVRDPNGAATRLAIHEIDSVAPNGQAVIYYVTVSA